MEEHLDAILRRYTTQGGDIKDRLPGAAFVLVNKDGVLYQGAAGKVSTLESAVPFAPDTFTWVASLTKLITVTCIMKLVEKNAMRLDDDMRPLLPALGQLQVLKGFDSDDKPILEESSAPITLRMLLTHTVGLGYDNMDPDLIRWVKATSRKVTHLSFSREGFTTPLKFSPGQGWIYGIAMDWAGMALEKTTSQSLGAYMQQAIFDPIGMTETGFWPERLPATASRTASSAFLGPDGTAVPLTLPLPKEHELESGGAGLYTTPLDYARFLRALLAGELVSEETLDEMFTPQLDGPQRAMLEATAYAPENHGKYAAEFPSGLPLSHGLGGLLNLEHVPQKRRKHSLMWMSATNCRWWIDRETGIAGVLIANCMPCGKPVNCKMYDELERAVYASL